MTSPLAGRTVLVTRPAERSGRLVKLLDERAARAIVAPAIILRPARSAALSRALAQLAAGDFAWVLLTSPSTVGMLADRLGSPRDVRAKVAAIGDGTAEAFRRWARRDPDLRPPTFTTAGLARAFPRGQGRVLCPRADIAPEGLEDALTTKGWTPVRVDAYRTAFPKSLPKDARDALAAGEVDAITFTSASTVRGFVGALGDVKGSPKVVCIGPVTAREARAHGLTVHAVADPHTTDGLVAALERVFARRNVSRRRPSVPDLGNPPRKDRPMARFSGMAQQAVPMLSYEDPAAAIGWLDRAFGFQERGERIVDDEGHVTHAELDLEGARVMLAWTGPDYMAPAHHAQVCEHARKWSEVPFVIDGVLVYVEGIEGHLERARAAGADVIRGLEDTPVGSRYTAADLEGHRWMFLQPR